MIYQHEQHSYRELSIRLAEFGAMRRYEKSGELSGLSRVRRMDLNDAHIFCTPDQILDEVVGVVQLAEDVYRALGITDHWYRLSMWGPNAKDKCVDNPEMWDRGQQHLKDAMARLALDYVETPGEAAFYGPKIDIQLRDPLGHSETTSTIQVDFHLPHQFKFEYVPEDGKFHRPVIIHRSTDQHAGTRDRVLDREVRRRVSFMACTGPDGRGANCRPPERVCGISCSPAAQSWTAGGSRRAAGDDASQDTCCTAQQVPYMLVVGDRDQEAGTASVRERRQGDLGTRPVDEMVAMLAEERDTRR